MRTAHGGHCAFLADPTGEDEGRWAEETLARWLLLQAGSAGSNLIADWSVEAAHDSPIITLPWEGWVDLHWGATAPNGAKTAGGSPARAKAARTWSRERAATLREAGCYPELLALLKAANHGPIRTAKVDVFPVTRDEVDPEIAEIGLSETAYGLGSYLDVLTAGPSFVCRPWIGPAPPIRRHAISGKLLRPTRFRRLRAGGAHHDPHPARPQPARGLRRNRRTPGATV